MVQTSLRIWYQPRTSLTPERNQSFLVVLHPIKEDSSHSRSGFPLPRSRNATRGLSQCRPAWHWDAAGAARLKEDEVMKDLLPAKPLAAEIALPQHHQDAIPHTGGGFPHPVWSNGVVLSSPTHPKRRMESSWCTGKTCAGLDGHRLPSVWLIPSHGR